MNRENDRVPLSIWIVFAVIAVTIIGLKLWEPWAGRIGKPPPAEARVAAPEEFVLKSGEEIPTVEVGPGTYHRLWANKHYKAVSVQLDGRRILYNMPAGWESWIGDEPAGRLRLIGKDENTIVRIYRRS